jgi:hypothetical protein
MVLSWFWSLIGGQILSPIVGAIPDFLTEQLRTRGVIRAQENRARLDIEADERSHAAQMIYMRQEYRRQELLEKYRLQTERYPLGVIGRLRDQTPSDDLRPAVLVSPLNEVSDLVHQALHDIGGFSAYAHLHTGGFVSDGGISRTIGGSVGAAEIGALEFPGHPAILIYFEESQIRLNAFAYLGSVFPSSDGRMGFPLRIASFGSGGGPSAHTNGSLPTWQYVNLDEIPRPRAEVVAALVAWFIATCVETYWRLQGVTSLDLRTLPVGAMATPLPPRALIDEVNSGSVFGCRLQREALALLQLGLTRIETIEYGDNHVALLVSDDDLSVSFVLHSAFPHRPPEVFFLNEAGHDQILLDETTWSPEHTLAEIVEAIR